MFPATDAFSPAAASIRPTSVVVVDLPFVPVMATTRPRIMRDASSTSPMIGTRARRARASAGCRSGTPGLSTIRSAAANSAGSCGPSRSSTPASARPAASGSSGFTSASVTRAPRRASRCAAAMPLRAAPTTRTRWPETWKSAMRFSDT